MYNKLNTLNVYDISQINISYYNSLPLTDFLSNHRYKPIIDEHFATDRQNFGDVLIVDINTFIISNIKILLICRETNLLSFLQLNLSRSTLQHNHRKIFSLNKLCNIYIYFIFYMHFDEFERHF